MHRTDAIGLGERQDVRVAAQIARMVAEPLTR